MKLLELCCSRKQKPRNCSTLLFNSYLENWKPHGKKGRYLPSLAWGGSNYFFFPGKEVIFPNPLSLLLPQWPKILNVRRLFRIMLRNTYSYNPCSPSSPNQRSSESALAGTLEESDEKVLPNANLDHFWKVLLLPFLKVPHGILTRSAAGFWWVGSETSQDWHWPKLCFWESSPNTWLKSAW